MASEILTEIFSHKESSYGLRNTTALHGRSINTVMYGSETISSLGLKNMGHFTTELKISCLPHYSKRKFVNGCQRIVHVVYVKRAYKTLDFCNLSVRTSLSCNM